MRNKIKFITTASAILALSLSFTSVMAETSTNTGTGSTTGKTTDKRECKIVNNKEVCVMKPVSGITPAPAPVSTQDKQTLLEKQKQELEANKDQVREKIKEERLKREKSRLQELQKIAQNQINRAQKEADRLAELIVRIKAQRVKLANPEAATNSAAGTPAKPIDLVKIDEMIAKAETLKKKIDADILDVKVKQTAIVGTLPKTEATINSDTSTSTTNTTAPAAVTQSVKGFQASMNVLKKDMITLHKNLQDIVSLMRKRVKTMEAEKEKKDLELKKSSNSADSDSAEQKEDQ